MVHKSVTAGAVSPKNLPTSEVVSPLEEQGVSGNGNRFELLETYLAICPDANENRPAGAAFVPAVPEQKYAPQNGHPKRCRLNVKSEPESGRNVIDGKVTVICNTLCVTV